MTAKVQEAIKKLQDTWEKIKKAGEEAKQG
jgi:hypothetical protein